MATKKVTGKLEQIRDQIEALIDERASTESAAVTRAEAEKRCEHLIARIRSDAITGLGPSGIAGGSFDEGELLRWLARPGFLCETFPAEIKAALMARFDAETSGTEPGLSRPERRAQLQALDAELCKLEAAEEAEIVKLLGEGVDVIRRPEADPRHALGIAIPEAA